MPMETVSQGVGIDEYYVVLQKNGEICHVKAGPFIDVETGRAQAEALVVVLNADMTGACSYSLATRTKYIDLEFETWVHEE